MAETASPGAVEWAALSSADKQKYLKSATRMIDRVLYVGEKSVDTQAREFPRGGDTAIPDEVLQACCEIALQLSRGITLESLAEESKHTAESTGQASVSFSDSLNAFRLTRGAYNSMEALNILSPWIMDPNTTLIERA
jgi:hypothetical protein